MENENRTPVPEQPVYAPEQPVYPPEQPVYAPEQPVYVPEQPMYPTAQPTDTPEQPPKKKTAKWKILVPIVAVALVLAILAGVYFLFLRKGEGVVGTWHFDGGYVNDEYVEKADATLYIYEDETAKLVIDGEEIALTWSEAGSADGADRYDVLAEDGTVCTFRYFTDPDDEYFGDLLLYRNDENMLYFKK